MKKIISILTAAVLLLSVFVMSVSAAGLSAPTVRTETIDGHSIKVSWSAVSGAESYTLYKVVPPERLEYIYLTCIFEKVTTTPSTSFTVKKLDGASQYKFAVTANGKTAVSKKSAAVTGATSGYYKKSESAYDEDGKLKSTDTYKYDAAGNLLEHVTRYGSKVTNKTVRTYDKAGKLIVQTDTDGDGLVTKKNSYTYGKSGNLLTFTQAYPSTFPSGSKSVRAFDADGYVRTDTDYANGKETGKSTNTYDKNGNMIKRTTNNVSGGTYTDTYEYDKDGNMVAHDNANYSEVNTYDKDGNVLTTTNYNADGSLSGKSANTYDKNGNLTVSETLYPQSSFDDTKWVYEYDKNGNMVKITQYDASGKVHGRTVKTYDAKGALLTEISYDGDSANGYKTVYSY